MVRRSKHRRVWPAAEEILFSHSQNFIQNFVRTSISPAVAIDWALKVMTTTWILENWVSDRLHPYPVWWNSLSYAQSFFEEQTRVISEDQNKRKQQNTRLHFQVCWAQSNPRVGHHANGQPEDKSTNWARNTNYSNEKNPPCAKSCCKHMLNFIHLYISGYAYIYMHTYMYIHVVIHIYIYMYTYMDMCVCMFMCIFMYIYICMYVDAHICSIYIWLYCMRYAKPAEAAGGL